MNRSLKNTLTDSEKAMLTVILDKISVVESELYDSINILVRRIEKLETLKKGSNNE